MTNKSVEQTGKHIIIQEVKLLDGKDPQNFLLEDSDIHDEVVRSVGLKNYDEYLHLDLPKDWGDVDLMDGLEALSRLAQWRQVLISREIAMRTLELCDTTGITPGDISAGISERLAETPYDRKRLLSGGSPNEKQLRKVMEDAKEKGLSLANAITQTRLAEDSHTLVRTSLLEVSHNPLEDIAGYGTPIKDIKKMIRQYSDDKPEGGWMLEADKDLLLMKKKLSRSAKNPRSQKAQELTMLRRFVDDMIKIRTLEQYATYTDDRESTYRYIPSNSHFFKSEKEPGEKKVAVPKLSDKDIEKIRLRREAAEADREAKKQQDEIKAEETQRLNAEHDAPIIETLDTFTGEYNDTITKFVGQTSRSLREMGILGKDSLEYQLRQSKRIHPDYVDRTVRVYAHLIDLAEEYGDDSKDILAEQLMRMEQLLAQHAEVLNDTPLRGKNGYQKFEKTIKSELAWLGENWKEFVTHIRDSNHGRRISEQQLALIAKMVGVDTSNDTIVSTDTEIEIEPDTETEAPTATTQELDEMPSDGVVATSTEQALSPLRQANRLAEQLNWVILPSETITPEELMELAETTVKARSGDKKPQAVEKYRMETLLALRDEFGGSLYRSDERTLGDDNNLYFVLRFKHPGDDNFYAVAENPVYGNATYVLREDVLPLQPGESVLSVLRLRRDDVRYFGAERIIHGTPDAETHMDKLSSKIVDLSEKESIVKHQR